MFDSRGRFFGLRARGDSQRRADAALVHQTRGTLDAGRRVTESRVARRGVHESRVGEFARDRVEVLAVHIARSAFNFSPPTCGPPSALNFSTSIARARASLERMVPTGHAITSAASA